MTTEEKPRPDTSAATTDVGEFITDLDGGQFDRKLSIALSQVAAELSELVASSLTGSGVPVMVGKYQPTA